MLLTRLGELADGAALLDGDPSAEPLVLVDLDAVDWSDGALMMAVIGRLREPSVVTLGIASAALPDVAAPVLEGLSCTLAPDGPGRTWVAQADPDAILATVAAAPLTAQVAVQLLPATARASTADGLLLESAAYSALLAGPEFSAWRSARPRGTGGRGETPDPVLLERDGDVLTVTLNRPERHNAYSAAVRDGLVDALELAHLDRSITEVVLSGAGRSFSSGGDLDEFGTAADVVSAHLTRTGRNAGRAIDRIRSRVRVRLHGACIGAGIEVPAFAGRVEADEGAWFLLPELAMGLVPGAGGTVSITRRIGPWRTAYLVLSGARIDLDTALDWGLVDDRA